LLEADLFAARLSVPPNENQDIIDFLRKLASMLTGGRNAVMLLEAAQAIEAQAERAIAVELLHQERQADHAKNLELREQAQLLSDRLMTEVTALKAQLAESERQAVTEVTALEAQLTESKRQAESERTFFAEEVRHLQARLEDANAQLAEANAELDELRKPVTVIDHSIAIVPVDSLQLARTQFDFLAAGFARNGDVISQTICQIGACAIDKALSGNEVAEN
jgi:predicted RNase H-like nuclease (RuvC/YqgF family)